MTQKDKDLLLKDLCARLPYRVKCYLVDLNCVKVIGSIQYIGTYQPSVDVFDEDDNEYETLYMSELKPYLFPLSSITPEQEKELNQLGIGYGEYGFHDDIYGRGIMVDEAYAFYEWCYKNHIDFRGFINMGLAIDATGLNIY